MELAQYGITLPTIFLFLSIGVLIGKFWHKNMAHHIEQSIIILLLFISSLFGSYLFAGAILTCFLYGTLACGVLGEWVAELLLASVLYLSKNFNKPIQQITVDTSLHTLPEAVKE